MVENVKVRWLTDHEQTKIAPKTLASQVYNEDGTLFQDKVNDMFANLEGDMATKEYVQSAYEKLKASRLLEFYCIEDVTIVINGVSTVYPANSIVEVSFAENDIFEIIPTSDNSILSLNAYPGALGTFYPWLEGVKQFSNILFDMNTEDMYSKWSQGNQGLYQVQFAQYSNCIFWSDNPYISEVTKRTNYTLYYTSQLPICYSTIPDNTFKTFFLALGVNNDPNWGNPAYRNSFAKANWATQAFSYYGARTVGLPALDSSEFNIVLPKDCRGLMFDSRYIENAGVFDAINTTNFGAKSGSWRDAFGFCVSLKSLYIKNLKVNLNISWSPIDYNSIYYIISEAANTNKITIFVSPYTYNLLSSADFELATSKNITITLLTENYVEDKRLGAIENKADKTYVDEKITNLVNSAPEMLDTIGELAKAFQDNEEVINALNKAIGNKIDKEDGKGLSTNDFTNELLEKVNNIENLSAKDWNQNDENHPEYIQNRPFYEGEPIEKIILPETNFKITTPEDGQSYAQVVPFNFNAEANKIYDVYVNNIKYTLNSSYTDEPGITTFIIGDLHLIDSPFVVKYIEAVSIFNITFKDALDVNEITLSIKENQSNIVQLDRKYIDYIPGEISEVGKVHIIDEQEYTVNKNAEIFNDYDKNIAVGIYSHAEGCETKAIGNKSHAEGFHTTALGENSHAEGYGTEALVYNSHAEGTSTVASGHGSHAEGNLTIAASDYQHVEGRTNIEDTENKYIHIAGNGGLSEDRSNAYTLDWSGNGWFAGDVYVGSTSGTNRDEGSKKLLTADDLTQSNWNQNDETSFDYIKNRPFYDTEEYEWIEILNNPEIQTNLFFNIIKPSPTLIENEIYKVIFNDNEYICTGRVNAEESSVIIGSENEDFTDNIPFIFDSGSGIGILSVKDELPSNFIIYKKQPIIKVLDRKYINYIPGEITEGKKVLYNNEEYLCDANAEIFNDYLNNIAIGGYSHAEGTYTMAIGTSSHAEGLYTTASGTNSHAEGYMTIADGAESHAEGHQTQAIGNWSHSEGYMTKASSLRQHVQGQCNIEDTEDKYAHIVGNGKPQNRSNAHTLDWEGNAWFQGDIYVNSTSGTNRDEGSKKLATEEYINIRVPAWTVEDEGKVLKIVNGTPTWV